MPIREESNESLQNREEKTRITPLESSKIAKSLTVQNINALIDQKNLIFNTINALGPQEKKEAIRYIARFSLDDAVSIILKSGKDQEIEEMILSTLFNINISQRYGTFMRKVKNTILGNITEKEDQQRRAINNLFRAPDVLSRIKRNKELKMPDAIIEDERKNIHPFVQQYNLTSEIIFKDDTSNLKKKIDDYYANFLVCREYSPITVKALSDESHDPVVRERVMLCINFVWEALLLKEKRDFKGILYPYLNTQKELVETMVKTIRNELPKGREITKNEKLGIREVMLPKKNKAIKDNLINIINNTQNAHFISLKDILDGYFLESHNIQRDDELESSKSYINDFLGGSKVAGTGCRYSNSYTHHNNQIIINQLPDNSLELFDRYGKLILGDYLGKEIKKFSIKKGTDSAIKIQLKCSNKDFIEMEIPLPTSSTDIPIQTKRDVFLLNALENNQYRKALQEILEAGEESFEEEMSSAVESNYLFDNPILFNLMLRDKENIKLYFDELPGSVRNEVGVCKVILKALGLIQKNKEQKLLDAIFGAEREIDQYARLYGEHDMKSKNGAFEKEDSSKAVIGGGDPIESQKSLDHMSFSTPVTSLLSTHLFTKREEGIRDSSNFQNTLIPSEEYKEVETTLDVEDRDQNHHYLPFNINGSIAEKSIKCIDSRGTTLPYEIVKNEAGIIRLTSDSAISQITYTQCIPTNTNNIPKTSSDEYAKFSKKRIETHPGCDLSSRMGKLPIECEPFIFSISTLSPREKILAVEDFLAQTWYADIHNDKEWSTQKATKDPEIQMQMCMDRITYLQVHYPNDVLFLKHKLFAGVCHDIQVMRLMMHRKLGLLAGYSMGFHAINQTELGSKDAHGWGFVLFPSQEGEVDLIEVNGVTIHQDGTVSGGSHIVLSKESQLPIIKKKGKRVDDEDVLTLSQLILMREKEGKPKDSLLFHAIEQRRKNMSPAQKRKCTQVCKELRNVLE